MRPLGTFLFFLGLYGLTQSGRFHVIDEYETFFVAESLLDRGSLAIPQVEGSEYFFGKRGPDGEPYAPYGVGQSLLTIPFLAAGKALDGPLPDPHPDHQFWLWFFSSLSSAFVAAFAVACFHSWLLREGVERSGAAAGAMLLGAGTLVWAYATQYRSNLVVMAAFVALLAIADRRGMRWRLAEAALAVLAILTRADAVIGLALIGAYVARGTAPIASIRGLVWRGSPYLVALVLGAGANLALNWLRFGDVLDNGYPEVDDAGRPAYRFGLPDPVAMATLLVSPGKGLLVLSPLLLLGALRLPSLARWRRREALLAISMVVAHVLVFSAWQHYEGGWCFGPRFLVPVIPFLLMPLALDPIRRWWTGTALAVGIAVNIVAISVNFLGPAVEGDYYRNLRDPDAPLEYNALHNPFPEHLSRGAEAWTELLAGRVAQGEPGTGLDFWWSFALKESVPIGVVVGIATLELLVLVTGLWLLRRSRSRGESAGREPPAGASRLQA